MTDFYEIDFHNLKSKRSGDAITMRYRINEQTVIHIVDGGFQESGELIVNHIRQHYDNPAYIDHVVATHQDGDHAGGLRALLEKFWVRELWMLRPWMYADTLIHRFKRWGSPDRLADQLRKIYPNLAALEQIATERGTSINEPFAGAWIGAFKVASPEKNFYLDLVTDSEKTPDAHAGAGLLGERRSAGLLTMFQSAVNYILAAWGEERFSPEETSLENEMSVVQYGVLNNDRILLTGDAGRRALTNVVSYAPMLGIALPGIDRFQVPHHGSWRNLSTDLLDQLLGTCLRDQIEPGNETKHSYVCASKDDEKHPRKVVKRAMFHRGYSVRTTEERSWRISQNAPDRPGWTPMTGDLYPEDMEE